MSLSVESRRNNFEEALRLMVQEVGDAYFGRVFIDIGSERYANILGTTWKELKDRFLVALPFFGTAILTPYGWLEGVKLLQLQETSTFIDHMARLSAALKGLVKGREHEALTSTWQLSEMTGIDTEIILNLIESRAIQEFFGVNGAELDVNDTNRNCILVPIDYGLRPL